MKKLTNRKWKSFVLFLLLASSAGQADSTPFADGLVGPVKLDVARSGVLVVTERGTGVNDGRVSLIDRYGYVTPLLGGLPSGIEVTGTPSGPTAVVVDGCCVIELLIGEGRNSNPFAMVHPKDLSPLVIDAGGNSVVQIRNSGPPRTLLRFAPVPNPTGMGPPVSDAVPTSIRHLSDDKYLVTLFVGVPFVPGTASVRLVDARSRSQSELVSGLTSVSDVLRISSTLYVLELSTDLGRGLPGQLLRIRTGHEPEPIASGLIDPSGMVYSRRDKAFYIAEIFIGQITRVGL